jgi:hypothetical protein
MIPTVHQLKARRFQMRRLAVCFMIVTCLGAKCATPQPDALTKKFLGAWRLVSVEGELPGRPGIYDRPTGLIVYDRSGRMSAQIATRADRKPLGPIAKASAEDKAAAFDTYIAYFGTYAVDAKAETVTHHIEESLAPGRRGADNVRWFEFQGNDRLLLIPVEDGKGGTLARKDATYKLLWERVK